MTEKALITKIEGNVAYLKCNTGSGCKSCAGGMFCNVKNKEIQAHIIKDVEVQVNDWVEVYIPPAKAVGAGFMVLILPLIIMMLSYAAIDTLLPDLAEMFKVLVSFTGLGLGFGINILIKRFKKPELPLVTKLLKRKPSDP